MTSATHPFDALRDEHRLLERLFGLHQEALLDRDWEGARRLLERYCGSLQRHIEIEEKFLLAAGKTACEADATGMRWGSEVYRAEHRRIALILRKIVERVVRAARHGLRPAAVIALLDQERTLKHLIEHHHHREEVGLFDERRRTIAADDHAALSRALAAAVGVASAA